VTSGVTAGKLEDEEANGTVAAEGKIDFVDRGMGGTTIVATLRATGGTTGGTTG
jgi:hypothetical protein